ncbi:MAG: glutamate racemase [Treponema sp.]|jgi:glutamate racemase|nr:glutamate racemase [Treponema sp.]
MARPVAFLDSGVGGIPYCDHFRRRNPGEPFVYVADRRHFPYGNRSREDLVAILTALIGDLVKAADPKLLVLACNTATVSALPELRRRFPGLPFVGTVPAVKPAAMRTKTGKVGVLGTGRTIGDPYIAALAARYGKGCAVEGIAAPELVELVEFRRGGTDREARLAAVRPYITRFREAAADSVVLGCTHFLFLVDEFRAEASPDITIYDSMEGITSRVESLLDAEGGRLRAPGTFAGGPRGVGGGVFAGDGGLRSGAEDGISTGEESGLFVVTEETGLASWRDQAIALGARFCTLDDLKARGGS